MLDEEFDVCAESDSSSNETVETLSAERIIPKEGNYLGLDISKDSTGLCLIQGGERITGNIELTEDLINIKNSPNWVHSETLLRRALKQYLGEAITGLHFDAIVIEDAFSGENPEVTRMLYGLNTAIDEMILDGVCSCDKFIRVNNKAWKSWIGKVVDPMNKCKGLNDKEKIKAWLNKIGIDEGSTSGFQDRLDATGLLIGYFLQKDVLDKKQETGVSITWSKLSFAYELDTSFIFDENEWLENLEVTFMNDDRYTKKSILEKVKTAPNHLFISTKPVYLGLLAKSLKLSGIDGGGYFAFWVKKSSRKKLFGEE